MKTVKLNDFVIGADKLTVLCGPCAIESKETVFNVADFIKKLSKEIDVNFVFKASLTRLTEVPLNLFAV